MMELKVYNPEDSFLKRIEWNYEELKNYIEPISAEYAASVYTDDMIKKAKEDACVRRRPPRSGSSMRITSMTLASIFRLNV